MTNHPYFEFAMHLDRRTNERPPSNGMQGTGKKSPAPEAGRSSSCVGTDELTDIARAHTMFLRPEATR